MALTNLLAWSSIWKNVRKTDSDSNGMIEVQEFSALFKDYFPEFFDGKSISAYLKQYQASYDENLINYRLIKEQINNKIRERLKEMKTAEAAQEIQNQKDSVAAQLLSNKNGLQLNSKNLSRLNDVRHTEMLP